MAKLRLHLCDECAKMLDGVKESAHGYRCSVKCDIHKGRRADWIVYGELNDLNIKMLLSSDIVLIGVHEDASPTKDSK